jgi:hypothetical protein
MLNYTILLVVYHTLYNQTIHDMLLVLASDHIVEPILVVRELYT